MNVRSKLFFGYLFALIIYAGFTLLPAPSPITLAQYHLSALELRLIDVTIIILLAGIWFAGFYGYAKLRTYSQLIRGSKDGKPVAWLTHGILLLALWLPISMVISAILNYISLRHLSLLPATTIIDNYIGLLFPLAAFLFISKGARGLTDLARQRPNFWALHVVAIVLVYIGLIDAHLVAATSNRDAVYHLSIWLILTTLVAPYIYMWLIGLIATYELYRYRLKAQGIVYRSSWTLLSLGMGWLIVLSIALQYLTTITSRLSSLSIYWLLIIIYSVLLVLSVGFILIAAGARKLQKIEEV